MELLPDCRLKNNIGIKRSVVGNWVPVFCANCGCDGGMVPEDNMTFMFYLCNKCAETHGQIANTMMMPDEVFWERLKQEQLEKYGRFLSEEEMVKEIENESSNIYKLIKDRR